MMKSGMKLSWRNIEVLGFVFFVVLMWCVYRLRKIGMVSESKIWVKLCMVIFLMRDVLMMRMFSMMIRIVVDMVCSRYKFFVYVCGVEK